MTAPTDVIDLTHTIWPGMPVYPGTEPPQISIPCTIEEHGFTEKKISLYSHTGTHLDAPAHILKGARSLDQFPLAQFFGQGVVVDLSRNHTAQITVEDLQPYQARISPAEFVLLYTGWDSLWGQEAYFENYPVLTQDAARWLAGFRLKGVGMDMISIDPADTTTFPNHTILMKKEMLIIENLTNLKAVVDRNFVFCCTPLKLETADGSPIRAAALL